MRVSDLILEIPFCQYCVLSMCTCVRYMRVHIGEDKIIEERAQKRYSAWRHAAVLYTNTQAAVTVFISLFHQHMHCKHLLRS